MLAYSEQMRDIAARRSHVLLAAPHNSRGSSTDRRGGGDIPSTVRYTSGLHESDAFAREGVRGKISVSEAWGEERGRRISNRVQVRVPPLEKLTPEATQWLRPASLSARALREKEANTNNVKDNSGNVPLSGAGHRVRQRRLGVVNKPDSAGLFRSHEDADNDNTEDVDDSPSPSFPHLTISPFPEFRVESPDSGVEEWRFESQGASHRSSPAVLLQSPLPKKAQGQKLGVRKAQNKRRIKLRDLRTRSKNHYQPRPKISQSPRRHKAEKAKKLHEADKSPVCKRPFLRSFRYSEEVNHVLQDFEDCSTDDRLVIRRASEILPSLDLQELRHERKRLKEARKKSRIFKTQAQDLSSGNSSPDSGTHDDLDISGDEGRLWVDSSDENPQDPELGLQTDSQISSEEGDEGFEEDTDTRQMDSPDEVFFRRSPHPQPNGELPTVVVTATG